MKTSIIQETLDRYLSKLDPKKQPISLFVSTGSGELAYRYSKESPSKPFHIFGVSKLFMVALIQTLQQEGMIDIDLPIIQYIQPALIKDLFVFRDIDHAQEVTSRHLLEHTSGINDYFEGIDPSDRPFIDVMLNQPNHLYHPLELLDFTRQHQVALGTPGQRFYYADTGYVLLGLIIESVTNMTLSEALKKYLFDPLKLKNTHLGKSDDIECSPVYYNHKDIKDLPSLSSHWGGSGIISTHEDLHVFIKALFKENRFDLPLNEMRVCCKHDFSKGLKYGLGIMSLQSERLPFLIKSDKLPILYGHNSFYGTHVWYDPKNDVVISLNQGTNKQYERGFKIITHIQKVIHVSH